ncbi:MAG TPA: type II secretion system F family protein [Dehalococcoidia bacterium]|nr:type II secretion system F family protein [Dehalococcoidia bacterium]
MDALALAAALSVSLTTVLLLLALGIGRTRSVAMAQRLQSFQEPKPAPRQEEPYLRRRIYSSSAALNALLAQFRGSAKVAANLERAGIPMRVGEYYLIRWGLALLFFLVPLMVNRSLTGLIMASGLAAVGYMLPAFQVASKKRGRLAKLNAQMVDMLDLVSNSLKSGYGLMQSFEFASQQMQPPLAGELRRMLRETSLGKSAEAALLGLGERVGSPDLDMVLTAINIQRAVGGNLSEILDNVSFTLRERERIKGEIRTLTAQQKMSGIILGGLPVGVAGLFMVINADYMGMLFTDNMGRIMLGAAVGLEALGVFVMGRILAIDI